MYLSVSLITYNGAAYIQEQLDSILQQSKKVDEIIIVDDGSTDDTINIIQTYQAKEPTCIQLFINDTQLGSTRNMEKALRLCKGDIIFLSDQDDIWMPNKVASMLRYFESHPSINALFSNAILIDKEGRIIKDSQLWDIIGFDFNNLTQTTNFDLYDFLCRVDNIVTGAGLAIRNTAPLLSKPFPKVEKLLHDGWIALWYAQNNQLSYINENLFKYRIHAAQQMGGKVNDPQGIKQLNNLLYYQETHFSNFSLLKTSLNRLENNIRIHKLIHPLMQHEKHLQKIEGVKNQLSKYKNVGEKQFPAWILLRKIKKSLGF